MAAGGRLDSLVAVSTQSAQLRGRPASEPLTRLPASGPDPRPRHHLGWQITGRCNRACRYCLRRRSDKPSFELGAEACARVLESYLEFVAEKGMVASIQFSGGNPLLRPDLASLLARARGPREDGLLHHLCILANPETLDAAAITHFAACRVDQVVISLDGRRENNDRMRGRGSFDAAVAAIGALAAAGVPVDVKYTLSRINARDVPYARQLVRSLGARHLTVGVLSRPDAAGDLSDLVVTPDAYRQYLLSLLEEQDAAPDPADGVPSCPLGAGAGPWALLLHELGRQPEIAGLTAGSDCAGRSMGPPPVPPDPARSGPSMRDRMFVVWEDGSVHASNPRAHPILGWVPQESFLAIHERRMAMGGVPGFPEDVGVRPRAEPTHAACRSCPVRGRCAGDDPYCWRRR